ncbi:MAG: phytanoyl-CoA dioxygenase family protein [Pseudomonadota bacterium]
MAGSLSPIDTALYQQDGFLFPIDVMSAAEALALRQDIEALEAGYPDGSLPQSLNQFFRVNGQIVLPLLADIARHPAVLDAVESILGPDLLAWSVELFIKEPHTDKIVSWHQDLTYWGMGETDDELTAWIAVSEASLASGCMRFVAGSHTQAIQPHKDTFDGDNLLSRGQELAVEVDEAEATSITLKPGQMSLHHGRMFHASGPNTSNDRRIGLAIRYVTPGVRQIVGARDYAMPVRGSDTSGNWVHVPRPSAPFAAEAMALYDRVLADQSTALTAGAENAVGLYGTEAGMEQQP